MLRTLLRSRRPSPPAPEPRPLRSLRDKVVAGLDLRALTGLEIGPLTAPMVRKDEGPIFYVDHADTATLIEKYRCDPKIDPARVVPVDFVWGERTLRDCVGPERTMDYVLASHVIEHVPDLVGWLAEIGSVLAADGQVRLAIPDRRFTFDFLRRESTLADVLDASIRGARAPLPRAILDHFLNYAEVDKDAAWRGEIDPASLVRAHPPQFALEVARRCFETGAYQDTHCWVFTPSSFASLGRELVGMGQLALACERLEPTEPGTFEFVVALRKGVAPEECLASWDRAVATAASGPAPGASR